MLFARVTDQLFSFALLFVVVNAYGLISLHRHLRHLTLKTFGKIPLDFQYTVSCRRVSNVFRSFHAYFVFSFRQFSIKELVARLNQQRVESKRTTLHIALADCFEAAFNKCELAVSFVSSSSSSSSSSSMLFEESNPIVSKYEEVCAHTHTHTHSPDLI